MATAIDAAEVQGMVAHWLASPVNGYLGSSYGQDLKSIIATPLKSFGADSQIEKLRRDVPVLQRLPDSSVRLYKVDRPPDQVEIYLAVGGSLVALDRQGNMQGSSGGI